MYAFYCRFRSNTMFLNLIACGKLKTITLPYILPILHLHREGISKGMATVSPSRYVQNAIDSYSVEIGNKNFSLFQTDQLSRVIYSR